MTVAAFTLKDTEDCVGLRDLIVAVLTREWW